MATSEENKRYRTKRRNEYIQRLGGSCVKCGTTRDLEFDHVDPTTKKFAISAAITRYGAGHVDTEEELKKCQLLCRKHHREKTTLEERKQRHFTHGTIYAFMRRHCVCQICLTAKWKWNDKRNAVRRTGKRKPYNTKRAGVA